MFNGLFNFDAKFWNTIIPLLISPGKVSRDYIDGKRQRYTNPFRFYLTVSIIFFLLVGLYKSIQKFEALTEDNTKAITQIRKKDSIKKTKEIDKVKNLDSIKKDLDEKMQDFIIPIPEKTRNKVLEEVEKEVNKEKDTAVKKKKNDKEFNIIFGGESTLDKFGDFIEKYPDTNVNVALDSLGYEKNFSNRFLYTRAKSVYSFTKSEESREQHLNQLLSYGSIALFVFLPFFTLFLKFYYIRRKFTYVDHLIFVFHLQTVFFMLFSIYFILLIFHVSPKPVIFLGLFALYLFLAMLKFYKQGYIKTFFKFLLINISFGIVAGIGACLLFLLSFAIL